MVAVRIVVTARTLWCCTQPVSAQSVVSTKAFALLQMLKKKSPPFGADLDSKVVSASLKTFFLELSVQHLSPIALQVENSSRSNTPLVSKTAPAESDWRLEEGDKPSRALQVVKELHARQASL